MQDKVQLSIILTTHALQAHFEELLTKTTGFTIPGLEIIIINDAADTATSQFIHQILNTAESDRIYLFEHETFTGRGNSLNEGVLQATAPLIWAPLQAERLNESLLSNSIRRFKTDPAGIWTLDYTLPRSLEDWITAAAEGELPGDSCLVWNRNVIDHTQFFFNSHLHNLHGAELALRLHRQNAWHLTDPFFVASAGQSIHATDLDLREFLFSALRVATSEEEQDNLLKLLRERMTDPADTQPDDDRLLKAREFLKQGDAGQSLEIVNKFLKKQPDHYEALRIKIQSLEKLRRHVEASELKHSLHNFENRPQSQAELFQEKSSGKIEEPKPGEIELSVVIPTTGLGKAMLESALVHLEQAADPKTTELIVIDNASIDDTFDYLQQLEKEKFFHINVITNSKNRGFGASVNQGIDAALGDRVLIMHNDVQLDKNCISELTNVFARKDDAGLAAPLIESPEPSAEQMDEDIEEAKVVDSCCFMIDKNSGFRFDQEYRLCHFDMEDFCFQILDAGKKIFIANRAKAIHSKGKTLDMMGLALVPHLKWKNRKKYYEKWNGQPEFSMPNQGSHPDRFEVLGIPENPLQPDPGWIHAVQDYLSDEVKTEILRTDWNERELMTIVSTLLVADERELLRTLEDRLDEIEVAPALLILFVHYYFAKNIYSRCKHYLEKAGTSHPVFDLFRLKIYVADKETDNASPILTKMLERHPASPDLFHLAGELYRQNGEEKESESFFQMAHQLDPFRFSREDSAFDLDL